MVQVIDINKKNLEEGNGHVFVLRKMKNENLFPLHSWLVCNLPFRYINLHSQSSLLIFVYK